MDTDFPITLEINRIAQVAAGLREFETDLPLAEALETQVSVLDEAQERYGTAGDEVSRIEDSCVGGR
jgi:hypothetical protein